MKKILAIVLSVLMVMTFMPSMAFAANVQAASGDYVLTLEPAEGVYTGSAHTPKPTLKDDTTTYVETTEYKVEYHKGEGENVENETTDMKDVGTYTVKAVHPNYPTTNTVYDTATYVIKHASLANTTATLKNGNVPVDTTADSLKDYFVLKLNDLIVDSNEYTAQIPDGGLVVGNNVINIIPAQNSNFTGQTTVTLKVGAKLTEENCTVDYVYPTTFTYNGKPQEYSTIRLKYQKDTSTTETLTEGTDFYVIYSGNTDAGTATYTIYGQGKYAGSIEGTFTIGSKIFNENNIYVEPIENQAIGATPTLKVYDRAISTTTPLKKGVNYSCTYSNNNEVGTAKVTLSGLGNYTGSFEKTYQIKDSLSTSYVSYANLDYDYTGSKILPIITVKSSTKTYVLNRDYKIEFVTGNGIDAGRQTFKLVGMGDYGGEFYTGSFEIKKKDLSDYDVTVTLATDTYIWAGKKIEPAVTIKANGRTLIKDTDYTIYCYNNDKIGTATMAISGKGNYEGTIYKTFKIAGKDFSTVTATLDKTTYDYNGTFHKPTATVYDGTKKLVLGTDYTIDYKDNKNCGTASAIITGKGNYTGTKTLLFDIVGKDQTITTNYTYYTKYLTSADFDLGGKTDGDGHLVYTSSNPAVAAVSAKGVVTIKGTGEAVIKVESKDDVKYNPDSKNVYVQVKPKKPAFYLTSVNKKEVRVNVTEVAGATKYQVRYGRMGNYYNKYVAHTGEGDFTVKLAKRTSGKTYFVKVRSYKKQADGTIVWGNWTTVKKIKSL